MMTDEMGIYLKLALAKNGDQREQGVIKQMLSLFGLARSTITPKPYADPSKNIPTITVPTSMCSERRRRSTSLGR